MLTMKILKSLKLSMEICYFVESSLVAEGIGKASIIPKNIQRNILFECHVIRLPLDLKICIPEFIQTLSTMNFFRNQINCPIENCNNDNNRAGRNIESGHYSTAD